MTAKKFVLKKYPDAKVEKDEYEDGGEACWIIGDLGSLSWASTEAAAWELARLAIELEEVRKKRKILNLLT